MHRHFASTAHTMHR